MSRNDIEEFKVKGERDKTVVVAFRVLEENINYLKNHQIDIARLLRASIDKACKQLRKKEPFK